MMEGFLKIPTIVMRNNNRQLYFYGAADKNIRPNVQTYELVNYFYFIFSCFYSCLFLISMYFEFYLNILVL